MESNFLRSEVKHVYTGNGQQRIEMKNGSVIHYAARTDAGIRIAKVDLLVLDDAEFLPDNTYRAALPMVVHSGNPQVWMIGNAVDARSNNHGYVFGRARHRASPATPGIAGSSTPPTTPATPKTTPTPTAAADSSSTRPTASSGPAPTPDASQRRRSRKRRQFCLTTHSSPNDSESGTGPPSTTKAKTHREHSEADLREGNPRSPRRNLHPAGIQLWLTVSNPRTYSFTPLEAIYEGFGAKVLDLAKSLAAGRSQ